MAMVMVINRTKEWQFNNLSNVPLSIVAGRLCGHEANELIEFSFLIVKNHPTVAVGCVAIKNPQKDRPYHSDAPD
jgi:hypothetical protein